MKNIYRRNRKVYAHNQHPTVTDTQKMDAVRSDAGEGLSSYSDTPKPKKVKIPSGINVILGNVSFDEAFAYHRSKGKSTFSYKGKKYGTETTEDLQKLSDAELDQRYGGPYPRKKEVKTELSDKGETTKVKVKNGKAKKTIKTKTKTKTNVPHHMKNPHGVGGPKI